MESSRREEARCPLREEWIKKLWSIYSMEYYSAIRNDKYPLFASTWRDLEGIMLSEISQSGKVNNFLNDKMQMEE